MDQLSFYELQLILLICRNLMILTVCDRRYVVLVLDSAISESSLAYLYLIIYLVGGENYVDFAKS